MNIEEQDKLDYTKLLFIDSNGNISNAKIENSNAYYCNKTNKNKVCCKRIDNPDNYDKKKQEKGIYGTASKQDLKELKEEGIDAQMIPWVEDKKN